MKSLLVYLEEANPRKIPQGWKMKIEEEIDQQADKEKVTKEETLPEGWIVQAGKELMIEEKTLPAGWIIRGRTMTIEGMKIEEEKIVMIEVKTEDIIMIDKVQEETTIPTGWIVKEEQQVMVETATTEMETMFMIEEGNRPDGWIGVLQLKGMKVQEYSRQQCMNLHIPSQKL